MNETLSAVFESVRNSRDGEAALLEQMVRNTVEAAPESEQEAVCDAMLDNIIGWAQFIQRRGSAPARPSDTARTINNVVSALKEIADVDDECLQACISDLESLDLEPHALPEPREFKPLAARLREAADVTPTEHLRGLMRRTADDLDSLARQMRSDACDLHQALYQGFDSETIENARNSLDHFAQQIDGEEAPHDVEDEDDEKAARGGISTYCGSMTEDALREHVSDPNACEPCAKGFPEFVEAKTE